MLPSGGWRETEELGRGGERWGHLLVPAHSAERKLPTGYPQWVERVPSLPCLSPPKTKGVFGEGRDKRLPLSPLLEKVLGGRCHTTSHRGERPGLGVKGLWSDWRLLAYWARASWLLYLSFNFFQEGVLNFYVVIFIIFFRYDFLVFATFLGRFSWQVKVFYFIIIIF